MIPTPCSLPDLTGFLIKDAQLLLGQSLGIGAFGRVHEATFVGSSFHKHYSSSPIAVKCLLRPPPSQGHERDSLQARELALHQKVSKHKNVVTIHQVVVDNSHFYVIMERCEGDLFEAIVDRKIFRENDDLIRNVFLQLLDGVEFCHQAGIFHRDLKPRNILCSGLATREAEGVEMLKIRLADFGLATSNRVSNTVGCGTARYMSPESFGKQFRTDAGYSTPHSDIWSLGVILFNMITAHNPWDAPTVVDDHFLAFLSDNDYLLKKYRISLETNNILLSIFNIDPTSRVSLSKLKNDVCNAKTFFRRAGSSKDTSSVLTSLVPPSILQPISSFNHSHIRHLTPSPMPTPQPQAIEIPPFFPVSQTPILNPSPQTSDQPITFSSPPFLIRGAKGSHNLLLEEMRRSSDKTSSQLSPVQSPHVSNSAGKLLSSTQSRSPLPKASGSRSKKVNMRIVLPPPPPFLPERKGSRSSEQRLPLHTFPLTISEEYPFPSATAVMKFTEDHDEEPHGGDTSSASRLMNHCRNKAGQHEYSRSGTDYFHDSPYPSSPSLASVDDDDMSSPMTSPGPMTPRTQQPVGNYIPFPFPDLFAACRGDGLSSPDLDPLRFRRSVQRKSLRRKNRDAILKEEIGDVTLLGSGPSNDTSSSPVSARLRTSSVGRLGRKIWKGTKRVFSG